MQRELVERARAGDHEAFSILVRRAFPRLRGTASLILRDPDRAQDAVQDALVLAWRNIRALRDAEAWDSWLYRTTVRACYRSARAERHRRLLELHVPQGFEPAGPDPTAAVAQLDELGRELDALAIDQRVVVVLHFYLGLPLGVMAEVLDIPLGTVKSRLHRAIGALRASMAPELSVRRIAERPA